MLRITSKFIVLIAVLTSVGLMQGRASADVTVYVDDDAAPGGDGLTWPTAHRFLQDGLAHAAALTPPVEVRVATGIYQPDLDEAGNVTPLDREATFQLLNGVALMGGYAGQGAPDPDERNIDLYVTTLSGDLADDDEDSANNEENSYHVVTGSGTDEMAVIDGHTITAGNANAVMWPDPRSTGGGMLNHTGSPMVRGCTFRTNWAFEGGAAMFNWEGASPVIVDCVFEANETSELGDYSDGAISNVTDCNPTISDCEFRSNVAGYGAAIVSDTSTPTITGCLFESNVATLSVAGAIQNYYSDTIIIACTFTQNSATSYGGAVHNTGGSPIVVGCTFIANAADFGGGMRSWESSPRIVNCNFVGNTAWQGGGGIQNWNTNAEVTNCTLVNNVSVLSGAGIRNTGAGHLTLSNSILWNPGEEIFNLDQGSTATVTHSNVEGGYAGDGNIDVDPQCRDLASGDVRLRSGSPCIDAGDNTAVPADELDLDGDGDTMEPIPFDMAGLPRFVDDPEAIDSGNSDDVHSLVDMGAYEFCRADAVPDGVVDVQDLVAVILAWGGDDVDADTNADGIVDVQDLVAVVVNWGPCE